MINRTIEWCAHNRFLVFTGVLLLVLAGIWAMGHIPLDALPDISDVQVIIHTNWEGSPPNIIEDQVTYPIVTAGVGVINSPQAGAFGGGITAHIEDVEAEISFDAVQLRDASGVTVNYDIGGAPARGVNNLIHADYLSRDFSITGASSGGGGACLLFYELLSTTSCATNTDVSEGLIAVGDVSGKANVNESLLLTSALVPNQFYDGATFGTTKELNLTSTGTVLAPNGSLTDLPPRN